MSKKLIAVASAAALAISALVAVPAIATGPAATFTAGTTTTDATTTSTGTSSTLPATIKVPDLNALNTSGTATLATITVSNLATGDVVRFDATGSVRLIEETIAASSAYNASTLGKTTFTKTLSNTTTPQMFAYTTSTTAGTVVVTITRTGLTSTSTLHLKGIAGQVYVLTPVAGVPATLAKAATSVVTFTAEDVYGNKLESTAAASTIDGFTKSNMGTVTYDATAKNYRSTMTSPSSGLFLASIVGNINDVDGLKDSSEDIVAAVNNTGVSSQVANLTAQVAALTAQLANSRGKDVSVTKKKYNALAKRWNSAFPGQKVALKK